MNEKIYTKRVELRLTDEQIEHLKKKAKSARKSMSQLIRNLIDNSRGIK